MAMNLLAGITILACSSAYCVQFHHGSGNDLSIRNEPSLMGGEEGGGVDYALLRPQRQKPIAWWR